MRSALSLVAVRLVPLLVLPSLAWGAQRTAPLELRTGDRVCLLGNALAERMQHHGWLEARLQLRFRELGLVFRNLGFSADELTVQQRTAGFGSWDEHLTRCRASVVLAFFGFNESFAGPEGREAFRTDLTAFVEHVRGARYDGIAAPRLVLVSPVSCEDLGDPRLPRAADEDRRLAPYVGVMAAVARDTGTPYVDLFTPTRGRFASTRDTLTINGVHLNERGDAFVARTIEAALFGATGSEPDAERIENVRQAVLAKNLVWFNRYRVTDGYNVYGGRSSLKYVDDVTNREVLQRELAVLDAMAANLDRRIHALARGASGDVPLDELPPLIEVTTNRPGEGPDGVHEYLGGEEALARMTPAAGMRVELFADEARFPELVNPVQMAWDARGRLWVAVWPTYPHWRPDQPMNDKLLILEDEDGDGRADSCKVFAGDLHNPTGFEFWNGGVLLGAAPDLTFLRDTDGDDVADVRERVLHGLSSADTHHSANSFVIGPDGALYFQEGTFHRSQIESIRGPVRNLDGCVWRFEPRTWKVERYVPYGFANPHGHVFDRWGQDFVTDGTGNVNYYALPFSGQLEWPARHSAYFPFFPQRSRPAAATEILASRHFPPASQGNYLIANVIGFQGIFQYRLDDDASGFAATELEPLVQSSDPSFRPVDLELGPDGALYFLDWHNALIGHMQHHLRDPARDGAHGRVYRVSVRDRPLLAPAPIAGRSIAELFELLREPEDRVRYRARIELGARDRDAVVAAARTWLAGLDPDDADVEHHRLEALWAQQQHAVLDQELLRELLRSADHRARAAATRALRHGRDEVRDPLRLLAAQVDDPHPRVRLEAVVALSFFDEVQAAELALRALFQPMDRFLEYALDETLRALEPHWKEALVRGPFAVGNPDGLARVIAHLPTAELVDVLPSVALYEEVLTRHALERADHVNAVRGLARLRKTEVSAELARAIERADLRADGHADHLLQSLFRSATLLTETERAGLDEVLRRLATSGRRASTRRLATAARIEADGSIDPAWQEATRTLGGLGDLLDAAPLIKDRALTEALFPRLLELLDEAPAHLIAAPGARETRGRFVRVELPGARRTLTLAEVEVLARGENVAPYGRATQSTIAWGGLAERAVDGNRSGIFADGGQTHTVEDQPDPWWELDLGRELPIDSIVLWNRTEDGGRWLERLDGFALRILDAERRTVFHERGGSALAPSITVDLSGPELRVRRAAARALGALGVREAEAVDALAARLDEDDLREAVVAGLLGISPQRWRAESRAAVAGSLLALFEHRSGSDFDTDADRELLALADVLVPELGSELGRELLRARAGLGPQVIVIRTVPDQMLYDRREITVTAGRAIQLVFDNVDIMPHNLLVTVPGALARVGRAAEAMAGEADAWERGYVPDSEEVLFATRLLQPGESQTLRFRAPDVLGDHPYVCTFPGHWVRMNGVMHVVAELTEPAPDVAVAAASEPSRPFVRSWTVAELRSDLGAVRFASPERGRAVLEAASCLACHAVDGEGGTTGPGLRDAVPRYPPEELLTHVLEPSRAIDSEFATEVFVLETGQVYAGIVVEEEAGIALVQDDPYRADEPLEVHLDEVAERYTSAVSAMPTEILSTFTRAEILDLLAYLESLRTSDQKP